MFTLGPIALRTDGQRQRQRMARMVVETPLSTVDPSVPVSRDLVRLQRTLFNGDSILLLCVVEHSQAYHRHGNISNASKFCRTDVAYLAL